MRGRIKTNSIIILYVFPLNFEKTNVHYFHKFKTTDIQYDLYTRIVLCIVRGMLLTHICVFQFQQSIARVFHTKQLLAARLYLARNSSFEKQHTHSSTIPLLNTNAHEPATHNIYKTICFVIQSVSKRFNFGSGRKNRSATRSLYLFISWGGESSSRQVVG